MGKWFAEGSFKNNNYKKKNTTNLFVWLTITGEAKLRKIMKILFQTNYSPYSDPLVLLFILFYLCGHNFHQQVLYF